MPAVLVTGPTAMHNSPFLPQQWPKPLTVLTALTQRMARLSGPEKTWICRPSRVFTNPSTNQTRHSLTLLTWTMPLPLHQTSHQHSTQVRMDLTTY